MQLSKELTPEHIKKLGQSIYTETEQLSRLINNLLQITYLESDAIRLEEIPRIFKDTNKQSVTKFT